MERSLRTCRSCGHATDWTADKCQNCGRRRFGLGGYVWLIGVAIFLYFIVRLTWFSPYGS